MPNNLPQQATTFIGRAKELDDLRRLLATTRLLTLTGSGGCGKTRLALQLAANALDDYPDGVWLVELAPLSEAERVAPALAKVLGVQEVPGKPIARTLVEHLADRRLLLVVDNCEHLLDAVAKLADALLRECPPVRLLASSREALGIAGEQAYRVPSLAVPEPGRHRSAASVATFAAVQLFADRAALARSGFRIGDDNAATVASICARLDGIPLAIELAAARVRTLSVGEIESKLNERFRLLTGGSRTALPRQQTLRSLIDWSYDLLDDAAKRLLQRLSVFAGGWTLEAAERVCAGGGIAQTDVLDLVTSLVDKSLAVADEQDSGTRYRLAETVRQYAREKLLADAYAAPVRDRHLAFFLALAEAAEPKLHGPEQAGWLHRLEQEHDNLRAALEWAHASAALDAQRLCGALQRFWIAHGHHSEGRRWCARTLSAEASAADSAARAKVLNCAGLLAYQQGDLAVARSQHEESLSIRRRLGDRRGVAVSLNNLGMLALDRSDFAAARALHEESLALARDLGNRNGVARSLGNLGMVAEAQHDLDAARALFEQCLAAMRELGDRDGIAIALHTLGSNAFARGDLAAARARWVESLALLAGLGHRARIAYSLVELGTVLARLGQVADGARLWGAAERLREEIGMAAPAEAADAERIASARAALHDDAAFDRAWLEGRALALEQAIALASEAPVSDPHE